MELEAEPFSGGLMTVAHLGRDPKDSVRPSAPLGSVWALDDSRKAATDEPNSTDSTHSTRVSDCRQ